MRTAAACGLLALALVLPSAAFAASGAQVRSLARRASTDPAALVALRGIRTVDGHPADLRAALETNDRSDLDVRLRVLAAGGGSAAAPFDAHAAARSIVKQRRFHGSSVPRPLHGFLVWLGGKLRPIGRAFDWVARYVPFKGWGLGLLLSAIVLGLALFGATSVVRTRAAGGIERVAGGSLTARSVDPSELERAADAAERDGDPGTALRLRFRAGLLRLGRARILPQRDSLTTAEARRALRLPQFDELAHVHDEVVYGGRRAVPRDAENARSWWHQVFVAKGVRT